MACSMRVFSTMALPRPMDTTILLSRGSDMGFSRPSSSASFGLISLKYRSRNRAIVVYLLAPHDLVQNRPANRHAPLGRDRSICIPIDLESHAAALIGLGVHRQHVGNMQRRF